MAVNAFELYAKIGLDSSALETGLTKALDFAKSGLSNLSKFSTGMIKKSVEGFANYEQLVGGIETLYGDSFNTVLQNAERAFQTAGMSQNEYMETSIQGAAALIKALNGDQQEAARLTDMSIQDMADNVNKMGTELTSLQYAYRGFSRGNFTMLDNLALGYSGTKQGMQELLSDAERISGIKYDISSYADIVQAIHVIQNEMGITGTTAAEASGTISGSFNAMKSAWENLTVELSKDDNDISKSLDMLIDTSLTAFDNVAPRIETALGGLSEFVEKAAPILAEKLPPIIEKIIPPLVSASSTLVYSLGKGIIKALPSLTASIGRLAIGFYSDFASSNLGGFDWLREDTVNVVDSIKTVIGNIDFDRIIDTAKTVWESLSGIFEQISGGFEWVVKNVFGPVVEWAANDILPNFFTGLGAAIDICRAAIDLLKTPAKAIWEEFLKPLAEIAGDVIAGSLELISKGLSAISEAVSGVDWEGYWFDIFEGKFGEDWSLGWKEVTGFIEDCGDAIDDFFNTSDIGKAWNDFWTGVGSAVYDFETEFKNTIDWCINKIDELIEGIKTALDYLSYLHGDDDSYYGEMDSPYAAGTVEYAEWIKQQEKENRPPILKRNVRNDANDIIEATINAISGFKKMAHGGVIVGEAGAEAVIPLENNTQWIDRVADRLKGSGGSPTFNVYVNGEVKDDYSTERFTDKFLQTLSERLQVYQTMQVRGVGGTF